jgi:hypothetical protein
MNQFHKASPKISAFVSKYFIKIFVFTFSQYIIFFELSQGKDLTKKKRNIQYMETSIDRKGK